MDSTIPSYPKHGLLGLGWHPCLQGPHWHPKRVHNVQGGVGNVARCLQLGYKEVSRLYVGRIAIPAVTCAAVKLGHT